jgi:hypothetical protein
MANPPSARKGARDPLAIDATLICGGCGSRSTLRSRRLRGVNDLSPFWPHWRFDAEGQARCPLCCSGAGSYTG